MTLYFTVLNTNNNNFIYYNSVLTHCNKALSVIIGLMESKGVGEDKGSSFSISISEI